MPNDHKRTSVARRHAAIMFTDVVRYTSLMGTDEDHRFNEVTNN
jgi:class 3 adenylate cyclase